MLSMIWAQAANGVIGNNGKIPWNKQKGDMHHFVYYTKHQIIVSGMTTFKSYHMKNGLPHRKNIVLTRHPDKIHSKSVIVFSNLRTFLNYVHRYPRKEFIICGGTNVYTELLPYTSVLQRTIIRHKFNGDREAVPINFNEFTKISEHSFPSDKDNQYPYTFQTWIKTKTLNTHKNIINEIQHPRL